MKRPKASTLTTLVLGAGLALVGCAEDDPETGGDGDGDSDGGGDSDGTGSDGGDSDGDDSGPSDPDPDAPFGPAVDESSCQPLDTDYQPTADVDDMWDACVTDDGEYHLIADTPGSIARVEAYEEIADLLWRNGTPSGDDFLAARVAYAREEGLESRVVRREDLHYDPIPMEDWDPGIDEDKQCTVEANVAAYPDRCVGPARMAPMLNDAFEAGAAGTDPDLNAARVKAALLWFLQLSTYKEAWTCTFKAKDCDSAWAYYTGGTNRAGGLGFAREIRRHSSGSHERVFDGVLAARCWRELHDIEMYPTLDDVPADGQMLYDLAWAQLDTALDRGMALVVRQHLGRQLELSGSAAASNWQFLQIAGPTMDRAARLIDAGQADALAALWAQDSVTSEDVDAGVAAIDALFPCG